MECIGFCIDLTSFPGMCYLIDFINTACTTCKIIRKKKLYTLLILKEEIDLIISKIEKVSLQIDNLSWYLLWVTQTYFHTAESVWPPKKMSLEF